MCKIIFANNYVSNELIEEVIEELKNNNSVNVCFNVIGRTKHLQLSMELKEKLKEYEFIITNNYGCKIIKN